MKKRIDVLMVERGLARSRTMAVNLLQTGNVLVDGILCEKQSTTVSPLVHIEIIKRPPYVSRGGLKLAHALDVFNINIEGIVAADVGSSTGGFTDCLLQHGARKVYAIDVGHGQLVPELRQDSRVISMEGTDIRTVKLLELVDVIVADVSFISLTNVFPSFASLLSDRGTLIVLVKPQFEVGKGNLGKNGVVNDETAREDAVNAVVKSATLNGFTLKGILDSPILGGTGNKEYLAYFQKICN